ncbi:MAG: hypothetical protein ACPGXK_05140 [Phycisphaerae bacterium]
MPLIPCHHCGSAISIAAGFVVCKKVEKNLPPPKVPGPNDTFAVIACPRCAKRLKVLRENSPEHLLQLESEDEIDALPNSMPLAPEGSVPLWGNDEEREAAEKKKTAKPASDTDKLKPKAPIAPAGSPGASVMYLSEAIPGDPASHSTFWGDVGWTFLFPSLPNNLMTFVVLWKVMLLASFIWALPCILLPVAIGMAMWYGALLIHVLRNGTSGERSIADLNFVNESWDDLVVPAFTWLVSWGLAILPLAIYMAAKMGTTQMMVELGNWLGVGLVGLALQNIADDPGPLVLVGLAAVIWPMTVLTLTLGGLNMTFRPEAILISIIRTMHTYWFLVLLTLALMAASFGITTILSNVTAGAFGTGPNWTSAMLRLIALNALMIYLDLVLMRVVGVFYHHRKEGFAQDWG